DVAEHREAGEGVARFVVLIRVVGCGHRAMLNDSLANARSDSLRSDDRFFSDPPPPCGGTDVAWLPRSTSGQATCHLGSIAHGYVGVRHGERHRPAGGRRPVRGAWR